MSLNGSGWTGHVWVYGSYKARLFCYYEEDRFFEYLGMLPCEFGHLSEIRLSAMAENDQGHVVGGTTQGGFLFSVDPETREVRSHGKPGDGGSIRHLVADTDGVFWGISAVDGQTSRLFRFDLERSELRDFGVTAGQLSAAGRSWTWHAFDIAAMAALPDGRILMGERGRQAKLLVFDPAIKP